MSSGIARDEWLKALAEIGEPQEDDQLAVSIPEFAAMFSLNRQGAERRLRALEAAGKATRTHKRLTAADGRLRWLVAYRLVP